MVNLNSFSFFYYRPPLGGQYTDFKPVHWLHTAVGYNEAWVDTHGPGHAITSNLDFSCTAIKPPTMRRGRAWKSWPT